MPGCVCLVLESSVLLLGVRSALVFEFWSKEKREKRFASNSAEKSLVRFYFLLPLFFLLLLRLLCSSIPFRQTLHPLFPSLTTFLVAELRWQAENVTAAAAASLWCGARIADSLSEWRTKWAGN